MPDFCELVARIKNGEEEAMSKLMEVSQNEIHRSARMLIGAALRSQLDSLDLVQSVQFLLWQGLKSGRFSVSSPEAFLALAKTLLRRRVSRYWQATKQMNATIECNLNETIVDQPVCSSATNAIPNDADFKDVVEFFLSQLGDLDRQMIKLRVEGHSTAEAARHLNVDPGYLRVRLGRLRTRFSHFRDHIVALSEKDTVPSIS